MRIPLRFVVSLRFQVFADPRISFPSPCRFSRIPLTGLYSHGATFFSMGFWPPVSRLPAASPRPIGWPFASTRRPFPALCSLSFWPCLRCLRIVSHNPPHPPIPLGQDLEDGGDLTPAGGASPGPGPFLTSSSPPPLSPQEARVPGLGT